MLKTIVTAIVSALKSALRFVGRVVTSPLKLLGGGSPWGMAEPPEPAPLDHLDELAEREKAQARHAEMANLLMGYAADCVIEDAPVPLPKELSPALKDWARGLTRVECQQLLASDERSISGHIQGVFTLPDVRKVAPLPPAQWSREPATRRADSYLEPDFNAAASLAP